VQGSGNADSIYSLGGPFDSAGGSVGDGPAAGGNVSWGSDSRGCPVTVFDVNAGLAAIPMLPPVELHGGVTDTGVVGFNIPGAAESAWHGVQDAWDWIS
jgi:hypothetical protein